MLPRVSDSKHSDGPEVPNLSLADLAGPRFPAYHRARRGETRNRVAQDDELAMIRAAVKLGLLSPQRAAEAMLLRKAKGGSTAFPQFLEDWGFLESDGRRTLVQATRLRPAGSGAQAQGLPAEALAEVGDGDGGARTPSGRHAPVKSASGRVPQVPISERPTLEAPAPSGFEPDTTSMQEPDPKPGKTGRTILRIPARPGSPVNGSPPAAPHDSDATDTHVPRAPLADPNATVAETGLGELADPAATASAPPPGERTDSAGAGRTAPKPTMGPFEIVGELGKGGMGKVYLARDPRLSRTVALKVMAADLATHAEAKKRFLREAQTAAKLDHPHIVKVYEVGEAPNPRGPGQPYIAMEYVEGTDLSHLLHPKDKDEKPVPLREALEYVRQTAEALGYAHKQGLVHRDVKPANILVTLDGTAKLTDFGLARGAQDEGHTRLTKTGVVMGTPHYMSPEQWDAQPEKIQAPADQYSVGAMIYEVLTGDPPFADSQDMRVLAAKAMGQDPPAPRAKNPKVHPDLETICLNALEKEPARRYASCKDLAKDLGRFLAGEPIAARPAGRVERVTKWMKRNRLAAAGLGVGAAVVLAVLLWEVASVWQASVAYRSAVAEAERAERGGRYDAALESFRGLLATHPAEARWAGDVARVEKSVAGQEVLRRLAAAEARRSGYEDLARNLETLKEAVARARDTAGAARLSPVTDPRKDALFRLLDTVRAGEAGLDKAFEETVRAYGDVLALEAACREAHAALAELYFARFAKDEEAGRTDRARLCAGLARGYAEKAGEAGTEILRGLSAGGTVRFDTRPAGAEVYLFVFEEHLPFSLPRPAGPDGGVLADAPPVPQDPAAALESLPALAGNRLGSAPLEGIELPPRSYLFLLRKDGYHDVRYPVFLERGTEWDGGTVPLFRLGEVPDGWVYVPPGYTWVGGDGDAMGGYMPARREWVDGFLIMELELTVREYVEFLADQAFHERDDPAGERLSWPAFRNALRQFRRVPREENNAAPFFRIHVEGGKALFNLGPLLPDWPVMQVSSEDADAYVRWKNLRAGLDPARADPASPATWIYALPSDFQWERAARGSDRRAFVWGPDFDVSLCANGALLPQSRVPWPAGSFATDRSPFGVRDLAGSMGEWCAGDFDKEIGLRLLRSGAWSNVLPNSFRAAYRLGYEPNKVDGISGLRLVRTPGSTRAR